MASIGREQRNGGGAGGGGVGVGIGVGREWQSGGWEFGGEGRGDGTLSNLKLVFQS